MFIRYPSLINFHLFVSSVQRAFSLLELLIVLAIVGIIMCVAYPSYTHHLVSVRRTNVEVVLLDVAGRLEQFYAQKNSYEGATLNGLGFIDNSSYRNYYQIAINEATVNSYKVSAIPIGKQSAADTLCDALTLDQDGEKSISGIGSIDTCWP